MQKLEAAAVALLVLACGKQWQDNSRWSPNSFLLFLIFSFWFLEPCGLELGICYWIHILVILSHPPLLFCVNSFALCLSRSHRIKHRYRLPKPIVQVPSQMSNFGLWINFHQCKVFCFWLKSQFVLIYKSILYAELLRNMSFLGVLFWNSCFNILMVSSIIMCTVKFLTPPFTFVWYALILSIKYYKYSVQFSVIRLYIFQLSLIVDIFMCESIDFKKFIFWFILKEQYTGN